MSSHSRVLIRSPDQDIGRMKYTWQSFSVRKHPLDPIEYPESIIEAGSPYSSFKSGQNAASLLQVKQDTSTSTKVRGLQETKNQVLHDNPIFDPLRPKQQSSQDTCQKHRSHPLADLEVRQPPFESKGSGGRDRPPIPMSDTMSGRGKGRSRSFSFDTTTSKLKESQRSHSLRTIPLTPVVKSAFEVPR